MNENLLPTGTGFSEDVYKWLKWIVVIFLPAFATFYFALSGVLDLPNPETVMGVIAALTTFLGVLLGISNSNYYNSDAAYSGDLVVQRKPEGGLLYSMDFNGDPADIPDHDQVTFKVVDQNADYWEGQG